MILGRSLARVDNAWKFVNATYVLFHPIDLFRFSCSGFYPIGNMSGSQEGSMGTSHHKKRTFTPVLKSICTQSSPGKDVGIDAPNSYGGVEYNSNLDIEGAFGKIEKGKELISSQKVAGFYETQNPEVDAESNVDLVDVNKKISISITVDSSLVRFVKGKWGSTQRQIEEEARVKLIFPSSKDSDIIEIEGASSEDITKAQEKIERIIQEAIKSSHLDYSHFISLPLAIHPELTSKLIDFQNAILGDLEHLDSDSRCNIDRSIFIKPKTFHLTVLMLKLWNKERIAQASSILQEISSKVMEALDGRPVSIKLKGLECMKGSLNKARVLYASVEEIGNEGRLESACQIIIDAYTEAGLVLEKDSRQKLKLHATVMNARHRKRKKGMRSDMTFDARNIVKQYGSEDWGVYLIREAHLSQRFAYDENGYYHCCSSIPFPLNAKIE